MKCQTPGCDAQVFNGHHCAAGHLQFRDSVAAGIPSRVDISGPTSLTVSVTSMSMTAKPMIEELPNHSWWDVPKGTTLTTSHSGEPFVIKVFQLRRVNVGLQVEDTDGNLWRFKRTVLSAVSLGRLGPPPWDKPIAFVVHGASPDDVEFHKAED